MAPSDRPGPGSPDDPRRENRGQEPAWNPKAEARGPHALELVTRPEEVLPLEIRDGLRNREAELRQALGTVRDDGRHPAIAEMDAADIHRDLAALRGALGEDTREDLTSAWAAMARGFEHAKSEGGSVGDYLKVRGYARAAVHAGADGKWQLANRWFGQAERSLQELPSRWPDGGPLDAAASIGRGQLWDCELQAGLLMLDQGDQPDGGDNELAWMRLKALEPPGRQNLYHERGLLVAGLRSGREPSPQKAVEQAKTIAARFAARGQLAEAVKTDLILAGDLLERARASRDTPDDASGWARKAKANMDAEFAITLVQESRPFVRAAFVESPDSPTTLRLSGLSFWTEAVVSGGIRPGPDRPPKPGLRGFRLDKASRQLGEAGDPRAALLHRQLQSGTLDLPPMPLHGPFFKPADPTR